MDEFNRITVLVLGQLYEAFPQALRLKVEDVYEAPNENDIRYFSYTVEFLASEGYIKHQGASDEGLFFIEVILTMKGLTVLRLTPDSLDAKEIESLDAKETLGHRFGGFLKNGAKDVGKEVLKAAVNQFMAAAASGRLHF
jgi:hypothetical protein